MILLKRLSYKVRIPLKAFFVNCLLRIDGNQGFCIRDKLFVILLLSDQYIAVAQTKYMVSIAGIAEIKVRMSKSPLEKLLNQPIKLTKLLQKEGYDRDTVRCTYKDIQVDIVFEKQQTGKPEIVIWDIRRFSPQIKTRSGISIDDDKLKIISTYQGYNDLHNARIRE